MDALIGRSLGRYDITEQIGEGGMGIVYRAHDTRLDRDVAIKVLNETAVTNTTRIERFKREARAVARLSHPNIMEIHDFGAEGDVIFAVMELLEGIDLRQHMENGRIGVRDSINIARQVAEGLEAAHSEGVVHRDIKPENLFLNSDGRLKILDFGLAHLRGPLETDAPKSQTTLSLTDAGTVLGTPRYMSPEQARGQEIDCSSDIFSLGCVAYEMVTGKHPFLRKTKADTMAAILHQDPEPISAVRPSVSAALNEIVLRCLEKRPRDRFHSAHDLGCALQAIGDSRSWSGRAIKRRALVTTRHLVAASVGAVVMIAAIFGVGQLRQPAVPPPTLPETLHLGVVPFSVVGDQWNDQAVANGLAANIANGIVRLEPQLSGRLWVVEPKRSFATTLRDCPSIQKLFNVTVCLGGTYERRGDVLSLTLEITDAASGDLIIKEVIENSLSNVEVFQADPIMVTARLLSLDPPGEREGPPPSTPTNFPLAFTSTLRGTGLLISDPDLDTVVAAVASLEEAVATDPLYVEAWTALGDGYRHRYLETSEKSWLAKAFEAIDKALELRPGAEAYLGLSALHAANQDRAAEIEALEAAIKLEPSRADSYGRLALALEKDGRFDQAVAALHRAINLRPGYWVYHHDLADLYNSHGNYDAAAIHWRRVTECAPLYDGGYSNLGIAKFLLGDAASAQIYFERAIELNPDSNENSYLNLGSVYFDMARFADAAAMFEKAVELNDAAYYTWGNLGFSLVYSLQPDRAATAFRRGIDLAELELESRPDDSELLSDLAGYHAEIDNDDRSRAYLQKAIDLRPSDPAVLATIGETFEDLGDRDRALVWIGQAFSSGVKSTRFDNRPTLNSLIADPGYQALKTGTNQRVESDSTH